MHNRLNLKVNNFENKISNAATLIHIKQTQIKKCIDKKIGDVDKTMPEVSFLLTTTVLRKKLMKLREKIPGVNGLVTTTSLKTKIGDVENKVPDVSHLIKKIDYNAKISDIEEKYYTFSNYNKFERKILETKYK